MTLAEVSSKLGIAPSTLNQYELGNREPHLKTWAAMSDFYNVSVEYLMGLSKIPLTKNGSKAADLGHEMKKISDLDFLQSLTPDQFAFELLFIADYQSLHDENDLVDRLYRLNQQRHLLNEKHQFTASFVEWYAKNMASYQNKS